MRAEGGREGGGATRAEGGGRGGRGMMGRQGMILAPGPKDAPPARSPSWEAARSGERLKTLVFKQRKKDAPILGGFLGCADFSSR